MFTLFDVPLNHLFRYGTSCPNIVADFPESTSPEIRLAYFRTPFEDVLSRVRLELTSDISRAVFWVSLDKQVYVVICNPHRKYLVSEVIGCLREQLCHFVLDKSQYGVSALRTPHEVILARTNRMCMTSVLLHPNLYFYYHLVRWSRYGYRRSHEDHTHPALHRVW